MGQIGTSKKPAAKGWHPAFIVYQLRLKGLSLRKVAARAGYAAGSGKRPIRDAWPAMERVVADALGVHPSEIWPERYEADGSPKRGLYAKKGSTSARSRNGHGGAKK